MFKNNPKVSPFEQRYRKRRVFYSEALDWGLFIRISPKDWLRTFWGHPEADVIWYSVGPFSFYTVGIYS